MLLLSHFVVFGQEAYLVHQVEKPAEPSGGIAYLNQFVASNIQMPFRSSLKGINGKVFVRGIVEPDGSMSKLEVSRGLDTLCNAEAIRLMSLYKAWKPAILKGEKVRQTVMYPVTFRSPAPANFDTTLFAFVQHFDEKFFPTTDSRKYEYRSVVPVDSNGYVKADVVYEQIKGSKWKPVVTIPFTRKSIWIRMDQVEGKKDSIQAFALSARDENEVSHCPEVAFQENGKLLKYTEYSLRSNPTLLKEFDLKGALRKMIVYSDSSESEIQWYGNGQIRTIIERPVMKIDGTGEPLLLGAWDQTGEQSVKEGNGRWQSVSATNDGKSLLEEGNVLAGQKDGTWEGKWADGVVHYRELYDHGVFKEGLSIDNGVETVYKEPIIQPKFKGGVKELYKFLGQNIMYPPEAARKGIQGRVFLSFVVCEDGSLCDYKVEKSAGFGLDNEAMRVVKKMDGKWEPGKLRGKNVRVKYNLPINFQRQ